MRNQSNHRPHGDFLSDQVVPSSAAQSMLQLVQMARKMCSNGAPASTKSYFLHFFLCFLLTFKFICMV